MLCFDFFFIYVYGRLYELQGIHRPVLLAGDDDGSGNIVDSGGGYRGVNMGHNALLVVVVVKVVFVVVVVEVMEDSRF